jgi:branched-chain amino acid transport system ATP-binding protein
MNDTETATLPTSNGPIPERVLWTEGLSISFGGVHAVVDVSLDVLDGEVLGLIGPNGAGKTTLLNLISGLVEPTDGKIFVRGRDVTRWSPYKRARLSLGRSYQTTTVFPELTVRENVWLSTAANRVGQYRPLPVTGAKGRELRRTCAQAIETTRLSALAERPASALGHGESRALEIAMIVASGAKVLLLDEPAAGVAAGEIPRLIEIIAQVHEELQATIVIVEHKLPVVFGLSDRVAVLDRGKLLAVGDPVSVSRDPNVRSAYLGEHFDV